MMWTLGVEQFQQLTRSLFARRAVDLLMELYPSLAATLDAGQLSQWRSKALRELGQVMQAGVEGEREVFAALHARMVFGPDFERTMPALGAVWAHPDLPAGVKSVVLNLACHGSMAALGATLEARSRDLQALGLQPAVAASLFPVFWKISNADEQDAARAALNEVLAAPGAGWGGQDWQTLMEERLLEQKIT